VNVRRLPHDGDAAATAAALRALAPAGTSVSGTVAEIVASVRIRGEQALREYVERFDHTSGDLRVSADDLAAALDALDPDVRSTCRAGATRTRRPP
jgi:histidinol dehydrogenase